MRLGDSVIATEAIRDDGTMDSYVPKAYPAVGDFRVVQALTEAAEMIDNPYHVGVVLSTDSYYGRLFNSKKSAELMDLYVRGHTLAVEMEISALYLLGAIYGLRTGAILTVREERGEAGEYVKQAGPEFEQGLEKSIKIAVKAIELMIKRDRNTPKN